MPGKISGFKLKRASQVSVGSKAFVTLPSAFNFALPKLSAAATRVKNGTGRGVLLAVGDSTTRGWGSGLDIGNGDGTGGDYNANNSARGWPAQLSLALSDLGLPSRSDAMVGGVQASDAFSNVLQTYAATLSGGSSWALGITSIGGVGIKCPDGNTNALTFKPTLPADRFDFLVFCYANNGTLTVSDANGTLGDVATNTAGPVGDGTFSVKFVTISRAISSTAPINIQRKTGSTGDAFVLGIIPYDSTSPKLEIVNLGFPGSKVGDWTATGMFAPFDALPIFQNYIDGCTLQLGINDSNTSVAPTTYSTGLQSLANRLAGYGDVLLLKSHRMLNGTPTNAVGTTNIPDSYLSAIDIIQGNVGQGLPAVNLASLASNIVGDYSDAIHRSKQGYSKEVPLILGGLKARV